MAPSPALLHLVPGGHEVGEAVGVPVLEPACGMLLGFCANSKSALQRTARLGVLNETSIRPRCRPTHQSVCPR